MRSHKTFFVLVVILMIAAGAHAQTVSPCANANRIVRADVVALDHIIMLNRLGAAIPEGMVYALKRDVVPIDSAKGLAPGNVRLRDEKRARPIVLRVNQYDCLQITFTNYLATQPADPFQTSTRNASIHVNGMQYYSMSDDGAWVGQNATSVASPGQTKTYSLYATEQGTFLLYTMGAAFGGLASSGGGNQDGAQQSAGLFGAVHVEPPDAEWYRSQVTRAELDRAFKQNSAGRYVMNWNATFSDGMPVLRMYTTDAADKNREIVYTDLTAVISGKGGGKFDPTLYPCNNPNGPTCPDSDRGKTNPNFSLNYAEPDRTDPYREFTIIYHEIFDVVQAFPQFYATDLQNTLQSVQDQFGINYGAAGIGAEILANRIGVGPMGGCPDCKYEEFFLDSWTVGDPAMVVDVPANAPCTATMLNLYQATLTGGASQFGGAAVPMNPPNISSTSGTTTAQINSAPVCNPYGGQVKNGLMLPQRKATKAFYPDDPSNVYHSYLNDNVKFRVLHGGTGFSHVHHQHAHQWLRTPNNNESTYLDSQLINPGSAYTLEITFGGSGNRNHTPGDSIFHCHFYPHFAGGMWSLWRVHDTFEPGTKLDADGRAASGYARALPDAEIERGTPTPAIVPLPGLPMAPRPADVRLVAVKDPGDPENTIGNRVEVHPDHLAAGRNPGYPFFIPGISGVRAPHPPLDFAKEADGELHDGGLPRHLILTGTVARESHSQFDFTKDLAQINAFKLPEDGTQVEKVAMKFHEKCVHATFTPEGASGQFSTNGRPPAPGAPYADPALLPFNPNKPPPPAERCKPVLPEDWKRYKAAVFQTDLVFNKQGWHYPQSRMLALWEDVTPTITGDRPPQPLFFRTDSDDATEYWHTNLVPDYYELDDFQVRTPTDIIGQHIHLVKFDVTSSDGASNGWNYEDGTFSPNEVRDRIASINDCGGLSSSFATRAKCGSGEASRTRLKAKAPPAPICGGATCPSEWWGAQTTVQRWMADPLKSPAEDPTIDRTLRTVFTHDHFGPSTHQQTGLYAAFLIEPPETKWFESETGTPMYTREDGGPTSWNAVIAPPDGQTPNERNTYREFAIALQDFQLAYAAGSRSTPSSTTGWADPTFPIAQSNAAGTTLASLFPQAVSSGPTQGTYTFNYRNEPLTYRLQSGSATNATDPAYAFASITRNTASVNTQPTLGSPINPSNPGGFIFPKKALTYDMQPTDPYTPLLRAYENDNVQVRVIVGAHMLPHAFTMPGLKWLYEPGDAIVHDTEESKANSGYRSTQSMGISEHFEFLFTVPKSQTQANGFTDFVYMPDSSNPNNGRGIVDGTWGLMRAYQYQQPTTAPLMALPNNTPPSSKPAVPAATDNLQPWWWAATCTSANTKSFNVYAQTSSITLNSNYSLTIPSALVYSTTSMATGSAGATNEPLLLRANAGDCIQVTLANQFSSGAAAFGYTGSYPSSGSSGGAPGFSPSKSAGLNPALLAYDVATSSGTNIGFNATTATVPIGGSRSYYWYAGHMGNDGKAVPMEFGAVNLTPADPVMQDPLGMVGGIIIEPKNTVFCADSGTQFSGYVYAAGTNCTTANPSSAMFRELVLLTQDNLNTSKGTSGSGVTQVALNYRQEPLPLRLGVTSASQLWDLTNLDQAVSNSLVSRDPATPVLTAKAGQPVRLHMLHPGGSSDQEVFVVHGHLWPDEPFLNGSTIIGFNPESQWIGSRDLYGTNTSYTLLIPQAGGANKVPGDYLYRTHPANFWQRGLWGLLRVTP